MIDWTAIGIGALPVVGAAIGALVWFIRLEASVKANRHDIDALQVAHSSLDDKLDRIDRNLHRIMGKMGIEPVE